MKPLHYFSMLLRCSSVTQPRPTLCYHMDCSTQASLSSLSQSWLKLMSIELVFSVNHLILLCPLLLLPSIFPSIRVFQNESAIFTPDSQVLELEL